MTHFYILKASGPVAVYQTSLPNDKSLSHTVAEFQSISPFPIEAINVHMIILLSVNMHCFPNKFHM